LLLGQANALLCDRIERGEPAELAFNYLERSLARRGLTGTLRVDDPEDRRRSAIADTYALHFLPAHLASLGRADEVTKLLLNPDWMTAKAGVLGAPGLLADYQAFAGNPDGAAGLVRRALQLVGAGLTEEFLAQLVGRLAPDDAPGLSPCLIAAARLVSPGKLLPLRPTLTRPGAELRCYEGHGGSEAVAGWPTTGARCRLDAMPPCG
jgi:hypothetical protein